MQSVDLRQQGWGLKTNVVPNDPRSRFDLNGLHSAYACARKEWLQMGANDDHDSALIQ